MTLISVYIHIAQWGTKSIDPFESPQRCPFNLMSQTVTLSKKQSPDWSATSKRAEERFPTEFAPFSVVCKLASRTLNAIDPHRLVKPHLIHIKLVETTLAQSGRRTWSAYIPSRLYAHLMPLCLRMRNRLSGWFLALSPRGNGSEY